MYGREREQSVSASMDSSPLLEVSNARPSSSSSPSSSRRGRISRIIRLMSGRRRNNGGALREPSVLVRETAADHLEERQSDWAYSRPVVILDLLWNLAFIIVSIVVLFLSRKERPTNPLRLWIVVYGAQCFVHMICVGVEYRHRRPRRNNISEGSQRPSDQGVSSYVGNPQISLNVDQTFDETDVHSQIRLVFPFF